MNPSKAHPFWIFDVLRLLTQILNFYYCGYKLPKIWWLTRISIICLFPWVRSLGTRWHRFSAYGHEVKVKMLIGLGCCLGGGGSLLLGLFRLLVEFCVVPGCWPGATLSSWINSPQPMVMDSLCVYQLLPSPLPHFLTRFFHLFCFSGSSIAYQDILG